MRPCPLCSKTNAEKLHRQDFVLPDDHPMRDGYDVVACLGCGFVYANVAATEEEISAFYRDHSKYPFEHGAATPWDEERHRDLATMLASTGPEGRNVLDFGCGDGGLLVQLYKLGFVGTSGLDPSPNSIELVKRQLPKSRHFVGTISDIAGHYDLITCCHVLEHVRDPAFILRGLAQHAYNLLYVEVPDASRYRDRVNSPYQDFNTEHINHFSPTSLINMAARAGWVCTGSIRKDVLAPPPYRYPCLGGLFKRGDAAQCGSDHLLKEDIKKYVEESSRYFYDICREIVHESVRAPLDARGRSLGPDSYKRRDLSRGIYLWGAGELCFKLLTQPEIRDISILGIVDSNPARWGWKIKGVEVVGYGSFGFEATHSRGVPILVASILHQEAIAARIKEMGLPNEVITLRGGR